MITEFCTPTREEPLPVDKEWWYVHTASSSVYIMLVGKIGESYWCRYIDGEGCSGIYPCGKSRPKADGMKPYALFTDRKAIWPYLDSIADIFVREQVRELDEQMRVNRYFRISEIVDAGTKDGNLVFVHRRVSEDGTAVYTGWLANPERTLIAKKRVRVDTAVTKDAPMELDVDVHMDPEDAIVAYEDALRRIWRTVMDHVRTWT